MASVDVVVPCYNYARYLGACVHSVLSQPGVDVRVIVIDDQSSDNTPQVAAELAQADRRVEVHRHSVNRGHIATYNEGLEMATADYVVLLSADDLLTPGSLLRATTLMDQHPNVGLTYGYPIPLYGDKLPAARSAASGWSTWRGSEWIEMMCRSGRNFITCPEAVMRTSVQHAIGGYRPSLPHSGDMEMWMRAASISDVGRINGADQAYYRIHSASMQRTVHAGYLLDLKARLLAFESALKQPAGGAVPGASAMLANARRSLARLAMERARVVRQSGDTSVESVDAYCEFARATHPAIVFEPVWRRYERAMRQGDSPLSRAAYPLQARLRRMQEYMLWRRWWRTGVY